MINNLKKFLNEEQDPAAIEKIAGKLNDIIMNGENVEYIAVQKKPAVNISPDAVALTNKRVIFCRPKNLGFSFDFPNYVWKDIIDCKLKEEFLGAIFSINSVKGSDSIDYLPKAQARRLYALAQEQEEIQRESRRQMDLEEKRANSGLGNQSNNSTDTTQTELSHNTSVENPQEYNSAPVSEEKKVDDITTALTKLKTLFDSHLISRDEYETKKADILARM